jgi:hypothetical protein
VYQVVVRRGTKCHDDRRSFGVSEAEKAGFQLAADIAGISLSSWVRERLRLAAIRDLESAGQKVPFIEPFELRSVDG